MRGSLDITSDQIVTWAERRDAADTLPKLLRRLLWATVPLRSIEMRADGGTRLSGFDGIVDAEKAEPFCPAEVSVWELSTAEDVERKLEEDFNKRVKESASSLGFATYVAVTARRLSQMKREQWIASKRALRAWADVRVIDADDLATWLEQAPAVAWWFQSQLDLPAAGEVSDVESFLEAWSRRTSVPLPSELALVGKRRELAAQQLRAWLANPTDAPLQVRADTKEEAAVFVAAAIANSPMPEREQWLARTLIIRSPDAWQWAVRQQRVRPLILVPYAEDFEPPLSGSQATLIIPRDVSTPKRSRSQVLELEPLPLSPAAELLERAGIRRLEAERYVREAAGKLPELQRLLGHGHGALPNWAKGHHAPTLHAMLLAGAWTPANEADREALRALGAEPGEVEGLCNALSRSPERPIRADTEKWHGSTFRWDPPGMAWKLLAGRLTETHLQQYARVVLGVLSEGDPRYDRPKEERFFVAVNKLFPHSKALREGLAESLVRLSLSDEALRETYGTARGSLFAQGIISKLLIPGWKRWASLSDLLPVLAEAAPAAFLQAVEESLSQGEYGVARLLSEGPEGGRLGPSPLMGLLWSLEAIGWSSKFILRVALALATLTQAVQGESSNRPLKSLTLLLHPEWPQSASSAKERLEVMRTLLQRKSDVGWRILLAPFEKFGLFTPSYRPRYLPWELPAEESDAPPEEQRRQYEGMIELMLEHARDNAERWASLVDKIDTLPEEATQKVLTELADRHTHIADTEAKLWATLRERLYWASKSTAEASQFRPHLEKLYQLFTPTDFVLRYAWLFQREPRLPSSHGADWKEARKELVALQTSALKELWELENRQEVLARLVQAVQGSPGFLGISLGQQNFSEELASELLDTPLGLKCAPVTPYVIANIHVLRKNDDWLRQAIDKLCSSDRAQEALETLLRLPEGSQTWDSIDNLPTPLRSRYWQDVKGILGEYPQGVVERVISSLLDAGNVVTALEFASYNLDVVSPSGAIRILEELRNLAIQREWPAGEFSGAYYIEKIFTVLARHPDIDTAEVVGLELFFLPLTEGEGASAYHLFSALETSAEIFVDILGHIYDPKGQTAALEQRDEEASQRARAIHKALLTWRGFPGHALPDEEREGVLLTWVNEVRQRLREAGHQDRGEYEIARVLARVPAAPDGIWPCRAARVLLEQHSGGHLADALRSAKYNQRGWVRRKVGEGGLQEHELAKTYRANADKLRVEWPRTAALLDELAEGYERKAELEDAKARSERRRYGWHPEDSATRSHARPPSQLQAGTAPSVPLPERLELRHLEPAPSLRLVLAPRLNLLAGDNSTGKTLVLDALWWAVTGSWTVEQIWPGPHAPPGEAAITVGAGQLPDISSHFDPSTEQWSRPPQWPTTRALTLYARVDGGFSVWDPIRHAPVGSNGSRHVPRGQDFSSKELWHGLRPENGKVECKGLLEDWVDWQYRLTGLFDKLRGALEGLSLEDEPLRPGEPRRISKSDARDIPTLELSYGPVPVLYASAAVKRVLGLAYLLVWAWHEHQEAARLEGQPPTTHLILLLDEVESHLHPKWQRVFLPALFRVIQRLAPEVHVQVVATTHAPLVTASIETFFSEEQDKVFRFTLAKGRVEVNELPWSKQGDAVNWLVSETFGLKQARSREAEQAIEAAQAFMRRAPTPPGLETWEAIDRRLREVLPGHDPFWPLWLVETGAVP